MSPTSPFVVTQDDFQRGFEVVDITGVTPAETENPYNCATPAAAARLLTHLNALGLHPTPTTDFPQPGWPGTGPYQQTGPGDGKVPYLDFKITDPDTGDVSTMHENVGGILVEYLNGSQRAVDYNCVNFWYKGAA